MDLFDAGTYVAAYCWSGTDNVGNCRRENILWVVGVISCVASVLVSGNATTITRKELADAGSYSKP